jgi:hypothetical protein
MSQNLIAIKIDNKLNLKELSSKILIATFVGFIFLRDLLNIPISSNVLIAIAIIIFIIADISIMLAFLAFLIPFTTGIPGSFITMFALIIYILKTKQLTFNYALLSVWIISLLELFNMFGTNNSLILYTRIVILLLFLALVLTNTTEQYDHYKIIKYYFYGYFWACIDIIFQTLKEFSISQFISSGIRFGRTLNYVDISIEGKLVSPNVNSLGIYSVMVITFIIILISMNKKNFKYLPLLIFAALVGTLTLSRTFIISLGVSLIFYIFISVIMKRNIVKNLLAMTSIVGVFAAVLINKFPTLLQFVISRFQVEDISSGRLDISGYYTNYLLTHPKALVMGVGLQDYKSKTNYFMSAHNGTQEVIIAWGIIGMICIIFLFNKIYKNAIRDSLVKNKNTYLLSLIPAFVFIVSIQASRLFSAGFLLIMIIPCYSIIRMGIMYTKENKGVG